MKLRDMNSHVDAAAVAARNVAQPPTKRRAGGVPRFARNDSKWAALALLLLSTLLLMAAASDIDPGGKRFDKLGHAVMCQCGCGQVMLECNHVGCTSSDKMRKELKAAMDLGEGDQQILAGFVSKYGPTVLSAPTKTGFSLVAWIMPVVITVAALLAVTIVVRTWKRRAPATNAPAPESAELDEFRRRAREETTL